MKFTFDSIGSQILEKTRRGGGKYQQFKLEIKNFPPQLFKKHIYSLNNKKFKMNGIEKKLKFKVTGRKQSQTYIANYSRDKETYCPTASVGVVFNNDKNIIAYNKKKAKYGMMIESGIEYSEKQTKLTVSGKCSISHVSDPNWSISYV